MDPEFKMASLIWCEKGYEGEAFKYDIAGMYMFIMQNAHKMFPIKKGLFRKITQSEFMDSTSYGIYRCKIEVKEEIDKNYSDKTSVIITLY